MRKTHTKRRMVGGSGVVTHTLSPRRPPKGVLTWLGGEIIFSLSPKEVRSAIAIWLILPVVIRLSQRLSHACLSINESIL